MNDIIALRKRLVAAAAAFPIGAASMLAGCADTEYQPNTAATTSENNGTSGTSATSGTTTSGTSVGSTSPTTTTTPVPPPPVIDPDCPPRDSGELTIDYEDNCFAEGEWVMPREQASLLGDDACAIYFTEPNSSEDCPTEFQLRPIESTSADYRAQSLYLFLQNQNGE
ncbi:MAG: hypothetical protein AAFX99_15195, partial [Myxococcota bacterium]